MSYHREIWECDVCGKIAYHRDDKYGWTVRGWDYDVCEDCTENGFGGD